MTDVPAERFVQECAAFVAILSPEYLSSTSCSEELQAFLGLPGRPEATLPGVIVIERQSVPHEDWPGELRNLRGYRFWEESEDHIVRTLGHPEPRYFDLLSDVAHDVAQRLKDGSATDHETAASQDRPRPPALFLAEVSDDLDARLLELRRYLLQREITILPLSWYPREPARYREAARADLAQSRLFVQLLSEHAGKKSPDLPAGYIGLQHELAVAQGLAILQWRSPTLDVQAVDDLSHRALLEGATVLRVGFEEFKQSVIERWEKLAGGPEHSTASAPEPELFVFVNAGSADMNLARNITQELAERGIATALPMSSGRPSEIRADFEQNLLSCDALLQIYDQAPVSWVRAQLIQARKLIFRRDTPLRMCLFAGSGPNEEIGVPITDLRVVDGRAGVNQQSLHDVVDAVSRRAN